MHGKLRQALHAMHEIYMYMYMYMLSYWSILTDLMKIALVVLYLI